MNKKDYPLDKPLEELIGFAKKNYTISFEPVKAGDTTLDILQIKDMKGYIDKLVAKAGKNSIELPLWSKIWSSCVFLGVLVPTIVPKGAKILEIGSGVGVTGMIVAHHGHAITISDYDPDALLFSKINALKNGLEDLITVRKADFTKDDLGEKYDYIIGCEVLAYPELHVPMLDFIDRHLDDKPESQVIMSMDASRTTGRNFLTLASEKFDIVMKRFDFVEDGVTKTTAVFRLRRKRG